MSIKIPVIIDTDIGIDIDDTWALGFLLQCQELELKLVTVATGDVEYRARIAAKFLTDAGYSIPVGIGIPSSYEVKPQSRWVENYDLSSYSGGVYHDGIDAMIDVITKSAEMVTIICIGPLTNIAEALYRCPEIAYKAKIVSMSGSIKKGVEGKPGKIAEYNIVQDIKAAQQVFSGQWPISITPLDTCGIVKLQGDSYKKVHVSKSIIAKLIMQNYEIWDKFYDLNKFKEESSVLFDTVAVYMAYCHDYLVMEPLKLRILDDGCMQEDENGKEVNCALEWRDVEAFENLLAEKLITSGPMNAKGCRQG